MSPRLLICRRLFAAVAFVSALNGGGALAEAFGRARVHATPQCNLLATGSHIPITPVGANPSGDAPPFRPGPIAFQTGPSAPGYSTANSLLRREIEDERRSPNPYTGPPAGRIATALVKVGENRRLLVAYIQASAWCGSAGCSTWFWLDDNSGGWHQVGEFSVADGNVEFARTATAGMPDLVIYGGPGRSFVRFDARSGKYREAGR